MDAIDTETVDGVRIDYHVDESPSSPREWDNLGRIVAWHRRYTTLGDKPNGDGCPTDPADFPRWARSVGAVWLPVYMLEHSGVALSVGSFGDPWDSGQVGYVYVTRAGLVNEYGVVTPHVRRKARRVLAGEVETYGYYVNGEVYGYVARLLGPDGDPLPRADDTEDSCWGYYGLDDARSQAREAACALAESARERARAVACADAQAVGDAIALGD